MVTTETAVAVAAETVAIAVTATATVRVAVPGNSKDNGEYTNDVWGPKQAS